MQKESYYKQIEADDSTEIVRAKGTRWQRPVKIENKQAPQWPAIEDIGKMGSQPAEESQTLEMPDTDFGQLLFSEEELAKISAYCVWYGWHIAGETFASELEKAKSSFNDELQLSLITLSKELENGKNTVLKTLKETILDITNNIVNNPSEKEYFQFLEDKIIELISDIDHETKIKITHSQNIGRDNIETVLEKIALSHPKILVETEVSPDYNKEISLEWDGGFARVDGAALLKEMTGAAGSFNAG